LPGGIGQPNFTIDETTNRINGFSYDPAGNLTGDGAFTYAYDGARARCELSGHSAGCHRPVSFMIGQRVLSVESAHRKII
jgi:hypothetical protein